MESYEASREVFTRVQNTDLENASKIMGYILLNHDEKDMIHMAYGPENLIISLVNKAKTHLGLSSNTLSTPLVSPISNPIAISRPNPLSLPLSSPRLSNGFNPSSPSSPSIWSPHHVSVSPNNASHHNPLSYRETSFLDDFHLKDHNFAPFVNDPLILPTKNVDFNENTSFSSVGSGENNHNSSFNHRRSSSFNDSYFGSDDSSCGFGVKPCLYYSRGFCKNGTSCNFVHVDDNCGGGSYDVAFEQCQEDIFRSKIAHQQRLAAQLMANGVNLPYNKLNFLHSEAQRSAAALMISEDYHKLNRLRMARNEFAGIDCNHSSRQIYLTFPADSTFKEEDVSNYFNKFGPVQDVRIPYQQKRMFGFVTFVFPETVKIILAKGNPHFVCESRVLVKPYKEKGKLPDKKHHQHQFERGDFSCSSPSGLDCMEPYDFQLGGRMMYNTQEMLLRKKLEEHALELQERRLMNMQLLDLKNQQNQHHVSVGSPIQSPNMSSQVLTSQTPFSPPNESVHTSEENKGSPNGVDEESNGNVPKKEGSSPNREENEFFESFDHALPENLFASPTKPSSNILPASFSPALAELDITASSAESSLSKAPLKSCFFEMPMISNGHGALGI